MSTHPLPECAPARATSACHIRATTEPISMDRGGRTATPVGSLTWAFAEHAGQRIGPDRFPKLRTRVRFPSPALLQRPGSGPVPGPCGRRLTACRAEASDPSQDLRDRYGPPEWFACARQQLHAVASRRSRRTANSGAARTRSAVGAGKSATISSWSFPMPGTRGCRTPRSGSRRSRACRFAHPGGSR